MLQAAAAAALLLRDVAEGPSQGRAAVMGFDVEWVPVARAGWAPTQGRGGEVCLLQLAGRNVSVIVDLCAWFAPSTPEPALLQVGPESPKDCQEAGQTPEAGGQGTSHCQEEPEEDSGPSEENKFAGKGDAMFSGSLGDAAGFKFERRVAEAALDDFLAKTLFRDDVLKVSHLSRDPRYFFVDALVWRDCLCGWCWGPRWSKN